MRFTLTVSTTQRQQLVDITHDLRELVAKHGQQSELCALYVQGATAAIMVQENWDPNITTDVLDCLSELVAPGKWLHDKVDGNADAHIKAGLVGPSELIPIEDGKLMLSQWQNVFVCDFNGPRRSRTVIVTLI